MGLGEKGKTAGIDDEGELGLVGADEGGETGGATSVGTCVCTTSVTGIGEEVGLLWGSKSGDEVDCRMGLPSI